MKRIYSLAELMHLASKRRRVLVNPWVKEMTGKRRFDAQVLMRGQSAATVYQMLEAGIYRYEPKKVKGK